MRYFVLASALVLASCSAVDPFHGKPRPTMDPITESQADLATLLTFEVKAKAATSDALREFANATGLTVREQGDDIAVGPFLSQFEAALLAGWVPDGELAARETYPDPATPEPWIKTRGGEAAAIPSRVGTTRALGERFALVTFGEGPSKSVELHQTTADGPRFLMKLPDRPSLEVSAGMLGAKAGDELTFMQVMNLRKQDAIKAERLAVWRFDARGRTVLRDEPFLELRIPDGGGPELVVVRVELDGPRARFSRYKATFKRAEAAKDVALVLNDWQAESWKDKPKPALVTFLKAEKLPTSDVSLE